MALNSKKISNGNSGDRVEQPVIEAGMYPSRIVQMIDLGLQAQRPYQGKEKNPANEIMITYELVDTFCIDKDGNEMEDKPRWISETLPLYSIDQEKAKSTQRYKAVDPEDAYDGDFSKLVEEAVNVSLVHNKVGDKTYVNVAGISGMRPKDAAKCPELKNPAKVFDLDDPDMEIFGSLPEWVQTKIKANLNYQGSKLQAAVEGKPADAPKKEKEAAAPEEEEHQDAPWD